MNLFRLLLLAALLAACTAEVRESDLFRPTPGGALTEAAGYSVTEHRIPTPDGPRLYAVHLRRPGSRATILYFGGNGYTIGRHGARTAKMFSYLDVDLMIVDHRGYGLSEGVPGLAAIDDGLTAFDYLRALVGPKGTIVVHGHSLGSFVAGHVAANRVAQGVVLESSATTAEEWAKARTPGLAKPFVKVRVARNLRGRGNLANMARIEEPLLLLVGEKDRTTPWTLSQSLYEASPLPENRKMLRVLESAGHNDVMTLGGTIYAYNQFLAGKVDRPAS